MFLNIFKKRKLSFQGRSGIIFTYENEKYYVDSEMLTGYYDMVIYRDSISKVSGNEKTIIGCIKKNLIFSKLIKELDKEKIKYTLQ